MLTFLVINTQLTIILTYYYLHRNRGYFNRTLSVYLRRISLYMIHGFRAHVVIIFLLSLGIGFSAFAKIKHVNLSNINVEDGLSQASVYSILQDNNGLMWFGSESGVNYYDGYNISVLPGPNGEFPSFSVNSIQQSADGRIWISFWNNGLYAFDPATNEYEFIATSDPENNAFTIFDAIEDNGNMWMITDKSLILYHPKTKSFSTRIDLSASLDISKGYIHKVKLFDNKLFIGTQVGTFVYSIRQHKLVKLPQLKQQQFANVTLTEEQANKSYAFAFDQDTLYIGTNAGVFTTSFAQLEQFLINEAELPTYQLAIADVSVWNFSIVDQKMYIATTTGLHEYSLINHTNRFLFEYSDYDQTVANSSIIFMFVDKKGLVWMGSNSAGVFIWDPATELVENYGYTKGRDDGLSSSAVFGLLNEKYNPDHLWVGTEQGLNLIHLATREVTSYLTNKDSKTIYNDSNISWLGEDTQHRLWLNTMDGIRLFDLKSHTRLPLNYDPEINQVLTSFYGLSLLMDDTLILSSGEALFSIDVNTGNKKDYLILPDSLDIKTIASITKAPFGDANEVFISTHDSFWLFNIATESFKLIYQHPNIISTAYTYVDSWVVDKDGMLWLAFTGVGIIGLLPDTYERAYFYNLASSNIEPNLYGAQLDKDNNLWFASHSGMYQLNLTTHHIRKFSRTDGFINTEFNSDSHQTLSDGRFAYGGMAGVSIFDPITLGNKQKTIESEVKVVGVTALSRHINSPLWIKDNHHVDLAYDDIGIRIDFSTLNYGKQTKPTYQYVFVDGVKYPETKQHYVLFPSLPSGQHIFEVRSKSPVTGEYSTPKRLTINVTYAPWRSPTAITIYCVLLLSLLIMWQRARYIRQRELLKAHEQVKYRENRLQLALSGSNSEVWDWKAETNKFFGKRLVADLGYKEEDLNQTLDEHINFIHPEDRDIFLSKWQMFILKGNRDASFECSYRLRSATDEYLWYKDLGKIVAVNDDGMPTRVTGSYTNITESKANRERAQYYGAAFEHTKDWVLIIDEHFVKVRANRSMAKVFDWQQEELLFTHELLGLSDDRIEFYKGLFPKIRAKGHWRGEELVTTPKGEQYHVLINISMSRSEQLDHAHYICVFTDITAQKSAEKELRYMANYDHLTGLPNRTLLLDRINHAIEYSARKGQSVALFFIDLDRFKQVNDSLGHKYGDMLLKEVTQRLINTLRVDDTIARIGGDEFVVLLESYSSNNQLSRIAQKIITAVELPMDMDGNVVSVGASIGIALFPEDSKNSDELLRNADVAMYHAKQQGRNNFQFFTQRMNEEATQRLRKESNLKFAVKNDSFFNLYQPIIDAYTGKAVGAELLMRWQHEDTIVSPVEFIPLAEELGLIVRMTDLAMDKGFAQLKAWRLLRPDFYLSVNFSAAHFVQEDLIPFIKTMLNKHQLPANALKIEVTESAFISDPARAVEIMNELNEMGVNLSLDDFGTGYSSLSYLKQLPLDIIKIDRSFVSGIGIEKTDEAIVDSTLVLASSLDMYCVAEGVETQDQLQYLVDRGCHYIQGYLYYKPLSHEDFHAYLVQNKSEIKVTAKRSLSSQHEIIQK